MPKKSNSSIALCRQNYLGLKKKQKKKTKKPTNVRKETPELFPVESSRTGSIDVVEGKDCPTTR